MKVPPSLDAAALSPGEIHAELETRLPYTWRLMPDSDTGLEDLTAWVWLLQDTCHRDGYAAGLAEARQPLQDLVEAITEWRDLRTSATPTTAGIDAMLFQIAGRKLDTALRAAASALADSAEKEGR
jgi:hypothetical protein